MTTIKPEGDEMFAKLSSTHAGLRRGLIILGALLLPGLVAAQTFPNNDAKLYEAAKKEGTVVWYESGPLEPMKEVATMFEKKYPGVKVEVLRIVGVAQYQRFMQEVQAKRHFVDILHISDRPSMESLISDGHVAEWKVPTHERFAPVYRLKNHAYANYTTDNAIVYNVNKVTPEEVKILQNWKGVLDPRFKGRFAVSNMKCGACYAAIHMFLDPKMNQEYGLDFLKKVAAQKPAVYGEVLVGLDRVIAGELDFTFWTWEGIANTKWAQGAPIRWIHPFPTPNFGNSWQAVSKYSPHPNAARLFQNWSMSPEGILVLQDKYGSATTLNGVPDQRKAVKEPWYSPIKQSYNPDWVRWDAEFHRDMDLWSKVLRDAR
jgi:iron(III) transport system substrate-binding protein